MNERTNPGRHTLEILQTLKRAALPTHVENFAPPAEISRRSMLKLLMGASAALAVGIPGCERKPRRRIVSRVDGPEYAKPGQALYYASTWTGGPFPYGVLIKTMDGRPIKIEGNPDHPLNRGSSDAAMQASLLSLYDPDRLRAPSSANQTKTWEAVDLRVVEALRKSKSTVLITRSSLGPSERALIRRFLEIHPRAKHFVYETVHDEPRRAAWRAIYGADGEWLPRFDRARVILSLDCDFLGHDGVVLENIRTFADGRRLHDNGHQSAEMSRLYVVESTMTITGSNADHRLRLRPSALAVFANALRAALNGSAAALPDFAAQYHLDAQVLAALLADLRAFPRKAVIVAGGHLPPAAHTAVALLNDALQAPGNTLEWNPEPANLQVSAISEIETALEADPDVLILFDVNPLYDWPGKDFRPLLGRAKLSIAHNPHLDETAAACTLALPSCHYLESWNDAAPRPGVSSLCQPVIAPLFDSRQTAESLLLWTQALAVENDPLRAVTDYHEFIQRRWTSNLVPDGAPDVESARKNAWETCLRTGGHFDTNIMHHGATNPPISLNEAQDPAVILSEAQDLPASADSPGSYEIVIRPHPAVYDGRFANNGWLQELPDPVSKVVWDNAAAVSPNTAKMLGLAEGDLLGIQVADRSVTLPALIQRGAADDVVTLTLGHGRTAGGRIALEAAGANSSLLLGRTDPAVPRLIGSAKLTKATGRKRLVRVQKEFSMHGRPIVLDGTLEEFRREVDFVKHKRHLPEKMVNLYEPYDYSKQHKWAMAIDLNACTGCGACMIACQAENNIPIVGREQCDKGREMHWIRIDRYEDGDPDDPAIRTQPMLCQHCDQAPCENVCPVNATTHSPEGLNEMTYNRCVGTRYCANNCPYKVRRFNYLRFHQAQLRDPVQELAFNPQVTVREVGVMEKCTFCVQRINAAKYAALNKGEKLADGAARTACQQACPAQAIVFGDVNDPNSAVGKARSAGRGYHVLEELNVKPSVTYLARVRNPNLAVKNEAPMNLKGGSQHG